MADYYPLLARALDTIREPTPEARQAVYGRARTALLTQLRSLQPPLAEAEIERERAALDDAIERAEAAQAPAPPEAPARGPVEPLDDSGDAGADEGSFGDRPPAIRRGGRQGRPLLTALAIVAVIAPIAAAAWFYRDLPAAAPQAALPAPGSTAGVVASDPKFTDRVAGDGSAPARPLAASPPSGAPSPAPPSSVVAQLPAPPAAPPPPAPQPVPTPNPAPRPPLPPLQAAPAAPVTPPAPPSEPSPAAQPDIAVAQRAMIAEENKDDPQQPKVSAGRAIWRTDMLNVGQGQQLETAVRAQVDIPEAGLSLLLTLQRNRDAAFPATSHTIELQFTSMRSGDSGRNVRDVGQLQVRADETSPGTRVAALSVLVKENVFLVALSSLATEVERNRELLLSRNWLEIPIRFASGQRAALLFEKGVSGERILADAFRQWSQP